MYHRYFVPWLHGSLSGEARFSYAVQAKKQSSAFHDWAIPIVMIRIHQISFDEVYDASRGSCVDSGWGAVYETL